MRRDRQVSSKSVALLSFGIFLSATFSFTSSSIVAAEEKRAVVGAIIANSKTMDSATRQITRTVANETLKSISTKESEAPFSEGLIVERLEDPGPIVLPAKIVSQPSPGTTGTSDLGERDPAAEPSEETAIP